jgi:hypothetical protein
VPKLKQNREIEGNEELAGKKAGRYSLMWNIMQRAEVLLLGFACDAPFGVLYYFHLSHQSLLCLLLMFRSAQ